MRFNARPIRVGRIVGCLAVVAILVTACGSPVATPSPTPSAMAGQGASGGPSATPAAPTEVRWFVGLGGGTAMDTLAVPKRLVNAFNAGPGKSENIKIKLEIVPNANYFDILKSQIAAGNAPDIVGPLGVRDGNGLEGLLLDLTGEIQKSHLDLSAYEPELVDFFRRGADGLVGLPYVMFPGYIWYNRDLFKKAGLPDLPKRVGATYRGRTWDWNELARVAALLTLDSKGRNSTQPGFDSGHIVQYGMDFQWCDARRAISLFGGGSFVAPDGKTAQIPQPWADAFNWYYDAVWKTHIVPNGAAERSALLAEGNSQSSGRIAMNAAWTWSISSIASSASTAKVKFWDMAVVPAWNGRTSSPNDADTFAITKASKHPTEAFKAMLAIMADRDLLESYGGEPGLIADRPAYFAEYDTSLQRIFPGIQVTWSVLDEMVRYPAVPSHESNMPSFTQATNDYGAFFTSLQTTPGLNVRAELAKLQATLQKDFDTSPPLTF